MRTGGSYASARDPRVIAGLGATRPERVEARWPAGNRTAWLAPPANRYLTLPRDPATGP